MNGFGLVVPIVHQDVLSQCVRSGKVSFASTNRGYLPDKTHKLVVTG